MKKNLLLILLCFKSIVSFSQEENLIDKYLSKIYNGFPFEMKFDSLNESYFKKLGFEESINIYDSSKVDFSKNITRNKELLYQPNFSFLKHYYAYDWGGIPEHSIITSLTLDYSKSSKRKSKKQFDEITDNLIKLTAKNLTYDIHAESGKIGSGYKFYKNINDSIPIIEVNLILENCTESTNYIYITYLRNLEN